MRRITILPAVAALAFVAGCGTTDGEAGDGGTSTSGAAVEVKTFQFAPDPLEVEAGTTVTWRNRDETVHTVTSGTRAKPDGRFDGELDAQGGEFRRTFDEPGIHRYVCTIHSGPGMEGQVIVR